ncbi:unnamed protein product, partial [Amoebophrya sp. A120]
KNFHHQVGSVSCRVRSSELPHYLQVGFHFFLSQPQAVRLGCVHFSDARSIAAEQY